MTDAAAEIGRSDIVIICGSERNRAVTTRALRRALRFVELSDLGSGTAKPPGKLGEGDQVDVLVRRESGEDWIMRLSPKGRETLIADVCRFRISRSIQCSQDSGTNCVSRCIERRGGKMCIARGGRRL